MRKTISILYLCILLLVILSSSGCINTSPANSTFGEKKIDANLLKLENNTTTGNYTWEGKYYYYVEGNITNHNSIDAIDVKFDTKFYAANGSEVVVKKKVYVYFEPKNIPAKGKSYFYVEVEDPKKQIVDYKFKVLSAKAELYA